MVGSTLFALGSLPAYAAQVDGRIYGATFFIGSVFFTSAAASQFVQVIDEDPAATRRRFWVIRWASPLWWSVVVQFVGTILFNVSTGAATIDTLDIDETNRLVWAPDIFGSVAFLVASHLGWVVVCGRLWCVRRNDADWWSAALNYVGSIFFMASAIASLTLPTTGQVVNLVIVNSATFIGAVCFLVGAYVLLPESVSADR